MPLPLLLSYLWYPLAVVGAVTAFASLLALGLPLPLVTYTPIVAVAIAVIILELRFPARADWRPRAADIRADVAFMALIQVVIPRALAAALAMLLATYTHAAPMIGGWPQHWPLAAQIVAIVLIVDFVRYWLHRACHHFPLLWRLHEVHHSPDILYTLNVGRFHPLEKLLQFCCDTLPFALLGVAPEVIAGYFLLYSVNGFFQHSNLQLRYGWLNYLVGSAETHRWHHARDPVTASCNFSNTTIVWDLLFRTWYLPTGSAVGDIGIMDRAYPRTFWAQMLTPFRRNDAEPASRHWHTWLANAVIATHLPLLRCLHSWRLRSTLRDPMRAQYALLQDILYANRDTTFGSKHCFATIGSYADFAQRVAVADYEALRPYVAAQIECGECALTAAKPIRYVRTSGTTGQAKDIPLTAGHLRALQRIHRAAVAWQHRVCPQALAGAVLAIVSPADEGVLHDGTPFGSASGVVAGNTPALLREKFVLPRAVLTIADSRVKYLLILRLALARPDITYIGTANPTTLLTLLQLYRQYRNELLDDLRHGRFFCADQVPAPVWSVVAPRLTAAPQRAARLQQLPDARLADLWPALRLVVMWTCASAAVAVDALRPELASSTRILELGYVASEFRGTLVLGRRAAGLPTLDTHFFEFAERERWDNGERELLTLDRLRKGIDYYIIVTTPSGLYRYFINDVVRVKGFLQRTPLLVFVQKGKGATNITGEKLYEAQVLTAVRAVLAQHRRSARFIMMLADENRRSYHLYVETDAGPRPDAAQLAQAVDTHLAGLNVEYAAKRESGRLPALAASWLRSGTGEAHKQFCVQQGQREGQFKTLALAYRHNFAFDLDAWVEQASA